MRSRRTTSPKEPRDEEEGHAAAEDARERGKEAGKDASEQARENRENAGHGNNGNGNGRQRLEPTATGAPPSPPGRPVDFPRHGRRPLPAGLAVPRHLLPRPDTAVRCRATRLNYRGRAQATFGARWSMSSGLVRLAPSIVCICVLAFFAPASRAAESPFASASEAFGRGDYRGAVALFEAARAEGADGPSVPYNIAVCRYKLGEFAAAEAEFADLGRRFPAMRAIAEYNRGLALLGLERPDDARAAFATARAEGDPKIATLADARLQELEARPTAGQPSRRWQGLFELAAGDDDNVALVDDLTLPAGQSAASPFTELLGYAARSFDGRLPATLDFSGYSVRYSDASQFDQDSLRASAAFEREQRSVALRFRAVLRPQHARRRRLPERARRKSAYHSSARGRRLAFRRESRVHRRRGRRSALRLSRGRKAASTRRAREAHGRRALRREPRLRG